MVKRLLFLFILCILGTLYFSSCSETNRYYVTNPVDTLIDTVCKHDCRNHNCEKCHEDCDD